MKIAFVCGSFEPGCDGVGDYIRSISGEMLRQGMEVGTIALNDKYINELTNNSNNCTPIKLAILRIPAHWPANRRFKCAFDWMQAFNPDWVSVQYVPYSFQHKGLPYGLAKSLLPLIQGRKVHIMFHELWLGGTPHTSVKHQIWGLLQRRLAVGLVRRLRPHAVHTSNRLYRAMLGKQNILSEILQIPSSIAVSSLDCEKFSLELTSLGIMPADRSNWILLGMFGTISPDRDYIPFLEEQHRRSTAVGKRLAFLSIGRGGPNVEKIYAHLRNKLPGEILLYHFGEKAPAHISAFLQAVDFGVTAVPNQLLDKSSAVAAMKLHNLIVLAPFTLHLPGYYNNNGIEYDKKCSSRPPNHFLPATVAGILLDDLFQYDKMVR